MLDIMDYIPSYPDTISRELLVAFTGLTDRRVRELIAKAAKEGEPICNLGKGYFVTNDTELLKRQSAVHWSRIKSELQRARAFGVNIEAIEAIERHFDLLEDK